MELTLISTTATERHWCLLCPDLIMPGEDAASSLDLHDPNGEQGWMHRDCAEMAGHQVAGEETLLTPASALRLYVRGVARNNTSEGI